MKDFWKLTCHGHSPGGQIKPPTILERAVETFFASTGIFPHGYFTGKKKTNKQQNPKQQKAASGI